MKRVFSLVLAVVMVALMIPFAAITTFAESPFYKNWDFTTLTHDDGADGDINPNLPEGFVMTTSGGAHEITDEGVRLNNAGQYFAMNSKAGLPAGIVDGTTDFVLEATWNVTHRIRRVQFGWTTTDPTYTPGVDGAAGTANVAIAGTTLTWDSDDHKYAGPGHRDDVVKGGVSLAANMYSANGTKITTSSPDYIWDFTDGIVNAVEFSFVFVVRDGVCKELYVFSEGALVRRYEFTANFAAKGYFFMSVQSGGSNTVNLKNIAVKELAENETVTGPIGSYAIGNILHNVDMSKVNSIDELPYTFFEDGFNGGKVWVENGALCQSVAPATSSATRMNGFVINSELFGASDIYTLDFTIAGGSESRILLVNPKMNSVDDFSDGNCFKLRMQEEYCCDGFNTYVYDATIKDWVQANADDVQALPADMVENIKAGKDINIRMVVNKVLSVVYITVNGQTVKALDRAINANGSCNKDVRIWTEGNGIGILQNTKAENLVAIKNIKIVNSAVYYGKDLPVADAQILMPADVAVVKVNGNADFVKAGATYTPDANVVAQVVGGEYVAAAAVTTEAGNIYSYVAPSASIVAGAADLRDENDVKGIRFTAKFDAYDLQTLVDLYEAGLVKGVEVGTLITTSVWADAAEGLTHEKLDAVKGDKTAYVEVMATIGDWYDVNTFAGTIYNVNAEREYQAVGFVKVTLANDTVVTVYTATTTATLASVTPEA